MNTLTLSQGLCHPFEKYEGHTQVDAISLLKATLRRASDDQLDGTEVEIGYKEYRRIYRKEDGQWCLDIAENGVGHTELCESRDEAIDRFVDTCSGTGEHWEQ